MGQTVGDFLIERLHAWGVRKIFGYPGDGINGVFGALQRAEGKIEFIQSRHEEKAAFMASAMPNSPVSSAFALRPPGRGHAPPQRPIRCQAGSHAGGGHRRAAGAIRDWRALSAGSRFAAMFKDVAGAYVVQAVPAQVRHLIDRADPHCDLRAERDRYHLAERLAGNALREPAAQHGTIHSGSAISKPNIVPSEPNFDGPRPYSTAVKRSRFWSALARLDATDEVIAVADRLGAGAAKALLGKAVLPDDLPWVTGSIGMLGTEPSYKMMMECDTLLMIGRGFPYSEYLPKEGSARGVQIDIQRKCYPPLSNGSQSSVTR